MKMCKVRYFVLPLVGLLMAVFAFDASASTNRKERRMVSQGNELFKGGHYLEAGENISRLSR